MSEMSVCPSARLSVKSVNCAKTKKTCTEILILYDRPIHLVFRHEEWLVGDDPLYLKFWTKLIPFEQKRRFSDRYA